MDIDKQMEEAHEIVDKASSFQVGGDHYKRLMIEPIDFIVQNDLPYACLLYTSPSPRDRG